mgnify:CR=1 FL=1
MEEKDFDIQIISKPNYDLLKSNFALLKSKFNLSKPNFDLSKPNFGFDLRYRVWEIKPHILAG